MHSLIVNDHTLATNVTRIGVLGSQHLSIAVLVAVHVAFISCQIVQVSAVVRFRAAIVRILVHRGTTERLVMFQYAGTLRFIADLFSENMIEVSDRISKKWKKKKRNVSILRITYDLRFKMKIVSRHFKFSFIEKKNIYIYKRNESSLCSIKSLIIISFQKYNDNNYNFLCYLKKKKILIWINIHRSRKISYI